MHRLPLYIYIFNVRLSCSMRTWCSIFYVKHLRNINFFLVIGLYISLFVAVRCGQRSSKLHNTFLIIPNSNVWVEDKASGNKVTARDVHLSRARRVQSSAPAQRQLPTASESTVAGACTCAYCLLLPADQAIGPWRHSTWRTRQP